MNIEKLSPKFWNEDKNEGDASVLEREQLYPHLEEIAKEIFRQENEIGSGNYSTVYEDKETGFCCKRLNPLSEKPLNNVHQEAEFLDNLYGTSEKVKIPKPFVSMDAFIRNDNNRVSKCSVLIMDTIKGVSLEEVMLGKKELPESFNVDIFFKTLREFIEEVMHKEKGVFHRDIADRNIMIEAATGKPVLIDFGNSVFYSLANLEEGDKDPYGHVVTERGTINEDMDLKRLDEVEQNIRLKLTNN